MTGIGAVVFDIGNVLIDWQPERWYDGVIGPARRRALFAAVDVYGMQAQVDLGADFRALVMATADAHPAFADDIRLWHDRWTDLTAAAIPRAVRLMAALQARGVPVWALSNFGIGPWERTLPQHPFLGRFDRAFVSGYLGIAKPDPRIYALVEAEGGLPGAALLFADDRAENIAAAAARGWRTHLFDGPEGWADRLVAEGLLTPAEAA